MQRRILPERRIVPFANSLFHLRRIALFQFGWMILGAPNSAVNRDGRPTDSTGICRKSACGAACWTSSWTCPLGFSGTSCATLIRTRSRRKSSAVPATSGSRSATDPPESTGPSRNSATTFVLPRWSLEETLGSPSGNTLAWDTYDVAYGEDGNSDVCDFKIYIINPAPNFYNCRAEGFWRLTKDPGPQHHQTKPNGLQVQTNPATILVSYVAAAREVGCVYVYQ